VAELNDICGAEMRVLVQTLVFALPFVLTGLFHVLIIRFQWLRRAAKIPLDLGFRFRGCRLFGDNKSLRGALVIIVGLALSTTLVAHALEAYPDLHRLSFVDFSKISATFWGILVGIGWLAGELVNSFVKRQVGIPPGGSMVGFLGAIFFIFDQLDGLLGALLLTSIIWIPSFNVFLHLVVAAFAFHLFGALIMLRLGLKSRVG